MHSLGINLGKNTVKYRDYLNSLYFTYRQNGVWLNPEFHQTKSDSLN